MTGNAHQILETHLLPIAVAFFLAWLIHRLAPYFVGRFMGISDYAPESLRFRQKRQLTLHGLLSSAISFGGFVLAILFTLGLFVDTTTLVWMVGLFSAAFGLGARPLISDYLTGISFIFEDAFDIGEKVHFELIGVEGVVEKINLRTLHIRSPQGELYVIPNGEIRVIRNFSRGIDSAASITLKLLTADLPKALPILTTVGQNIRDEFSEILEPWQMINSPGVMGKYTEVTLVIKVQFGKAAGLRPRLMAHLHQHLAKANITLSEY